ncbi:MAG: hypothetical protein RL385_5389 [Pseudomonadota bacterium]
MRARHLKHPRQKSRDGAELPLRIETLQRQNDRGAMDARALVEKICNGAWPGLKGRGVHLPDALERVVARACEREPARRYADAPSMLEDLEQAARSTTGVARQQEVAAFVERVAGPDLARRRALVQARRSLSTAQAAPPPVAETAPLLLTELVPHATEAQVTPPARTLAGRDLWAVGAALLALLLGMLGHRYLTADFGDKRRVEASSPTSPNPPQSARQATPPPLPSTAVTGVYMEPSAAPAAGAAAAAPAVDAGTQSRGRSVRRAEATLEKPLPTPPARQSAPGVAEGMLQGEPAPPAALPAPVPADGSGISKQNPYR